MQSLPLVANFLVYCVQQLVWCCDFSVQGSLVGRHKHRGSSSSGGGGGGGDRGSVGGGGRSSSSGSSGRARIPSHTRPSPQHSKLVPSLIHDKYPAHFYFYLHRKKPSYSLTLLFLSLLVKFCSQVRLPELRPRASFYPWETYGQSFLKAKFISSGLWSLIFHFEEKKTTIIIDFPGVSADFW